VKVNRQIGHVSSDCAPLLSDKQSDDDDDDDDDASPSQT
jgi:hypothetical protein